nr:RecName: Full=Aspartate racemase [Anadara broughtonii]
PVAPEYLFKKEEDKGANKEEEEVAPELGIRA